MGAHEHEIFISFVPLVFRKSVINIVCIVMENAAMINADHLGCGSVGCHSRRYNLAMNDLLGDYEE